MCAICGRRPVHDGDCYCSNCLAKLAKAKRQSKARQPVRYATYRGHVVGFYRSIDGAKLCPRLLQRKPENLPARITIDLNTYIEGYTRKQVQKLKAAILTLANN